jgi:hypothetical protein
MLDACRPDEALKAALIEARVTDAAKRLSAG